MSAMQRDERIDLLRFIGLMMVMLAHVYPPAWLSQLRNFDVPLMVLVSALSFGASYKAESYGSYVWARVKRLVFPVWLFLTLLFTLEWLTGFPQQLPSFEKILRTYELLDGIGYVWVIRVFLLVALVAPFIWRFHLRHPGNSSYFYWLLLGYVTYEMAVAYGMSNAQGELKLLLRDWLFYLWPYALVFAFGLKVPVMSRAQGWLFTAGFALLFVLLAGYFALQQGQWLPSQKFKYPPQHYYLAYALFVGLLLWQLAPWLLQWCRRLLLIRFVLFAGANSIWIYLWHIFAVQWLHPLSWASEYLLVCLIACVFTWLQVSLVQRYLLAKVQNPRHKKNLRALLTG
jgi:peptidoglycan/LPS O-acetylase OafA/YrhL